MNYEDHIAAAETFMRAEEMLTESGMGMAAAEVIWGAVAQVIDAANHRSGPRHARSNRNRRRTLERLERAYRLDRELTHGFQYIVTKLHNHFYTGNLSEHELSASLEFGRRFVNLMIELSGRERGEA